MLPVLAIVGRPNVGKSTLFNCLTHSRAALVSDLPGMTRDRQYGEAEIAGRHFLVVDTGGLTEERHDLDELTMKQSLQAILDADKILFLVDARAGVTPADQSIAALLRRSSKNNKPIYLVANKIEGLETGSATADFYQLGMGQPIPIAAAHKDGIDDLVNHVFESDLLIETDEMRHADSTIKLAFVGRPNVGKSTLTNRMLREDRVVVSDQPGTTRDSIFVPLEHQGTQYTLIDTAGLRRRGKVFETQEKFSVVKTLQSIQAAHVVLFMMDATEGVTDQDLRLLGFVIDSGKALVIAMNKCDNVTSEEKETNLSDIDRRLGFVSFARMHFISALKGSGVNNLFGSIKEAYTSASKKLSTATLTKTLLTLVAAHQPPLIQGRRIKLRYAHSGGHHPPLVIIHGNQVDSLPDSYIRYLANGFQKALKLIGTPIQIQCRAGENPYKDKKNILTPKQLQKKRRLIRHVKK